VIESVLAHVVVQGSGEPWWVWLVNVALIYLEWIASYLWSWFERFGWSQFGALIAGFLGLSGLGWYMYFWLRREVSAPDRASTATPGKYSVWLADLQGDMKVNGLTPTLFAELSRLFYDNSAFEVRRANVTISLGSESGSFQALQSGHSNARKELSRRHGTIIVWGVCEDNSKTVSLFVTAPDEAEDKNLNSGNLLDPMSWTPALAQASKDTFRSLLLKRSAAGPMQTVVVEELRRSAMQVESQLPPPATRLENLGAAQLAEASANYHHELGRRGENIADLEKAADRYKQTAAYWRNTSLRRWGSLLSSYGEVVALLADKEHSFDQLSKAIDAYESIKNETSPSNEPQLYAHANYALVDLQYKKGAQKDDEETLVSALHSADQALIVWGKEEKHPLVGDIRDRKSAIYLKLYELKDDPEDLEYASKELSAAALAWKACEARKNWAESAYQHILCEYKRARRAWGGFSGYSELLSMAAEWRALFSDLMTMERDRELVELTKTAGRHIARDDPSDENLAALYEIEYAQEIKEYVSGDSDDKKTSIPLVPLTVLCAAKSIACSNGNFQKRIDKENISAFRRKLLTAALMVVCDAQERGSQSTSAISNLIGSTPPAGIDGHGGWKASPDRLVWTVLKGYEAHISGGDCQYYFEDVKMFSNQLGMWYFMSSVKLIWNSDKGIALSEIDALRLFSYCATALVVE
jgi:hypothetical protein